MNTQIENNEQIPPKSAKYIFDTYYNKTIKRFGQNFLFDPKINARIVNAAGSLDGKTVVEIGPGPGGLTLEILKHNVKKLYLIEYDPHWANVWGKISTLHFNGKIEIINADALHYDIDQIKANVIISNLPYNISTQLLYKFLESIDMYEILVLMFQKEVAERINASPNTKQYGKMSVVVQSCCNTSKVFELEPGSFFPPPKVKSTVITLNPKSLKNISPNQQACNQEDLRNISFDHEAFNQFLTVAFASRRKMLKKQIEKQYPNAMNLLRSIGYSDFVRAEEISVNDYVLIANQLLACHT